MIVEPTSPARGGPPVVNPCLRRCVSFSLSQPPRPCVHILSPRLGPIPDFEVCWRPRSTLLLSVIGQGPYRKFFWAGTYPQDGLCPVLSVPAFVPFMLSPPSRHSSLTLLWRCLACCFVRPASRPCVLVDLAFPSFFPAFTSFSFSSSVSCLLPPFPLSSLVCLCLLSPLNFTPPHG